MQTSFQSRLIRCLLDHLVFAKFQGSTDSNHGWQKNCDVFLFLSSFFPALEIIPKYTLFICLRNIEAMVQTPRQTWTLVLDRSWRIN